MSTYLLEPFRILDHPADVGFEAFGRSLQELFANAAFALTALRVDLTSVSSRASVTVHVRGADRLSLLVNWLSEILYLEDAENWLFCQFKINDLDETSLAATAQGELFNSARHQLKSLVKAITYHQLVLEKQSDLWRAQVFVDV